MLQDRQANRFMVAMPTTLMTKVAHILERRGLKQADLCRALGVDSGRMTRWIQGTGTPDPYQALKIAKFLNVSLEYLADAEREGPAPDVSWLQDVERFVERVGVDELYMRLYGVRGLGGIPRVNPGDIAEGVTVQKPGNSPGNPRRSGSG